MLKVYLIFMGILSFSTPQAMAVEVLVFPNPPKQKIKQNECSIKKAYPILQAHYVVSQKQVKTLQNLYKTDLYRSFHNVLLQRGFPQPTIPKLFCIAYLESRLNPKAKNNNKNGTVDVGLFQINSLWTKRCGDPGRSLAANLDCAKVVLDHQGLNAWTTYKEDGWLCKKAMEG